MSGRQRVPMRPSVKKLVAAVAAEYAANRKVLEPLMPPEATQDFRSVQYAQNTLRTCMEATLNQMLGYDQNTLVELALRLASYAISAAPLEDQDFMVSQFMGVFADVHMKRVAEGKAIAAEWRMADGSDRPNLG